jgi:hypothetical protein
MLDISGVEVSTDICFKALPKIAQAYELSRGNR